MVVVDIEIALGLVTRNEVDGTPALLSISCAMPPVGERRWRARGGHRRRRRWRQGSRHGEPREEADALLLLGRVLALAPIAHAGW